MTRLRAALAAAALATVTLTLATPAAADPIRPSHDTSREEAAARSSRAQDVRGPMPSLYRGIYYHPDQEAFRHCVADREGSFTYVVRGGGGNNYFGTYQMSAALVRGASWMMAAESRKTHDGLYKEARGLLNVPGNKWSRYWQDRAFYTILNYNGKWTGKAHWAGGRWHC